MVLSVAGQDCARPFVAARGEHTRGGLTLWQYKGSGFSVVVFQTHDEPDRALGLDEDLFDMIEIRVMSALVDPEHFWDRGVQRVTHKKWSWALVCMDPSKSEKDLQVLIPGSYRGTWRDFHNYEDLVDRAIETGKKIGMDLLKLKRKVQGNFDPWYTVLKLDKGDPETDRFWCTVVYPDDFQWVVKIHYGLLSNFGLIYPRFWELGYRFDDHAKARKFALDKVKQQTSKGFAELNDRATLKIMKWSLREAMEDDD